MPIERLPQRLKCFVAMAFGKTETDRLYDRAIVPTLDAVNLRAIRVDRIEHNDDIDNRIIRELNDCHLAIADLTFARQSVYFEAGYAQRRVPVIYTCRKDHFDKGAPDDARVHFDLQMKNIIDWSHPDDPMFKVRLTKRLKFVLRPVLQEEQKALQDGGEQARFRALSVNEQRNVIKQVVQEEFARRKFKPYDIPPNENGSFTQAEHELRWQVRYGFKKSGTSLSIVEGVVPQGSPLKLLSMVANYEIALRTEWFEANKGKNGLYFSREMFVCTPEKISRQTLLRSFSNFTFDRERKYLTGNTFGISPWLGRMRLRNLPLVMHLLDGVTSPEHLRLQIRERLEGISLKRLVKQ